MPELRDFVEGRLAGYDAFLQNNAPGTGTDAAVAFARTALSADCLRRLLADFDVAEAEAAAEAAR